MRSPPSSCLPPLPHAFLPFLMPSSPSSCLPPLPHAFLPFLMPSSPSSCLPPLPHPFLPFLLPSSPSSSLPPLPPAFLPLLLPFPPSSSLPPLPPSSPPIASPSSPSPLLSFCPPSLPFPLPFPALSLHSPSLLILIAYALPCLSYFLPPVMHCVSCAHMIAQQVTLVQSQSQLSCIGVGSTPRTTISNTQAEISEKAGND